MSRCNLVSMSVYRPMPEKIEVSMSVNFLKKFKYLWFIESTNTDTSKVSMSVVNTFSSVYGLCSPPIKNIYNLETVIIFYRVETKICLYLCVHFSLFM